MELFRTTLKQCNLSDLGYKGSRFTWTNCQPYGNFLKVRLDRAMANSQWWCMFEGASVQVLAARSSDHKLLLLNFETNVRGNNKDKRDFKFEMSWTLDEEYQKIVEEAWNEAPNDDVRVKLSQCRTKLTRWSRGKFENIAPLIKQKMRELGLLQRSESPKNSEDIKILKGEVEKLLKQEDLRWKQRAKQNWYKNGDQNTQYFHAWANQQRRINRIQKVHDTAGREWQQQNDIPNVFLHHFQEMFTTEGTHGLKDCLEGMENRVTIEMNQALGRAFTEMEVDEALK
jgi:hypothetical protein